MFGFLDVIAAEQIVDRVQALLGSESRLPLFSNAEKNMCMKMNEQVL
jgi:hypothetical protein